MEQALHRELSGPLIGKHHGRLSWSTMMRAPGGARRSRVFEKFFRLEYHQSEAQYIG
jgi:hypothetical protein